jgi:DNA polymerase III subunit delta'
MIAIAPFETWPIQNDHLRTLHQRIERGTIPHAMLFVGNQKDAEILTEYLQKLLLCTAPGAPCGACESCLQPQHPDALRVELGDSGSVKTSQIEEIQERLSRKSHSGGRLVYIVPAIDTMTVVAANRLLKTLEEPNPSVFALLTASNLQQVLPTILSRCFVFPLTDARKALPWEDLVPSQLETAGAESSESLFAAGSKAVVQWAEMLLLRKEEPLLLADALSKEAGEIGIDTFLWLLAAWLRDVAHCKAGDTEHIKFSEFEETLQAHAQGVSIQALYEAIGVVLNARTRIRSHVAASLNLEQMCIRLREVLHSVQRGRRTF